MARRLIAGLLAAAAVLAGAAPRGRRSPPGAVKVAAGENFWGNIAAQIGDPHVQVTSILSSPGTDPHLYDADVASALAVAEAQLVIANGAAYDDSMSPAARPHAQRGPSGGIGPGGARRARTRREPALLV